MQGREILKYFKKLIIVDMILVDLYFPKKKLQCFVFPVCLKAVLICAFTQFEFLLAW
jgi:hypothetical protein